MSEYPDDLREMVDRYLEGLSFSQAPATQEKLRSLGMEVVALPTIMRSLDDRVALAHEVLDFAATIRVRREAEVE